MARLPRVIGQPTFDQHYGITIMIAYGGLKGEPTDVLSFTCTEALELAERLTRCARQQMRQDRTDL